jgi:hypothetical protein
MRLATTEDSEDLEDPLAEAFLHVLDVLRGGELRG